MAASSGSAGRSVLWFRRDLRLGDHPALLAAAGGNDASSDVDNNVLGLFVADDALLTPSGSSRRAFLSGCLAALNEAMDGRLLVLHGRPEDVLPRVARAVEATAVHVSADYMPYGRDRDVAVEKALTADDVEFVATGSPYAVAPGRVRKGDGSRFAVFTPYYYGWKAHGWRRPAELRGAVRWMDPANLQGVGKRYGIESLAASVPDGMRLPEPGERAAAERWSAFLDGSIDAYADDRNRPDRAGTSRMSPYLKWGCIHPRTMLADLAPRRSRGAGSYRRELAWREFYADVVFHLPESLRTSVDPLVDRMTWASGADADEKLAAWRAGRTGFPYIDAGMRQLLAEGWMHNRVRMGVASFLVKDLHLPWQVGARHFLAHLVDGDVASNNHGWQWVAGSGPQAAAFYRIFNPIGQGEKFDPAGDYVRAYVPELRGVAGKAVHRPWDLPDGIPDGYPAPIVDHAAERAAALQAWGNRALRS